MQEALSSKRMDWCCKSVGEMSGHKLFIDTNIIIHFLSGDKTLTELLEGKSIFISIITKLELLSYHDLTERDQKKLEGFLSECTVVELNSTVQNKTVEIRKQYKLKLPDSIFVASAIWLDLPIISSDRSLRNLQEGTILYYEKK